MNERQAADVAIVGGGPAGLGAAIELKQRGVARVVLLEREAEAGGIPRHCGHPPYGIREFRRLMGGPEYARRLRVLAIEAGVDIRVRHSVVALQPQGRLVVAAPGGVSTIDARRVILAMGAREESRPARLVSGDRPLGIMNTGTLQGCVYLKHLRPFRRPLVVGTELVSLSAIWTCLRHGIRPAAVIEANAGPTAPWPLALFPRLLGIPVHYGSQLTQIAGGSLVEYVEVTAAGGERRRIACDGVVLTGRFLPEAALLRAAGMDLDSGSGGPLIDQFGRCNEGAYYAAGNLLRPIETAGWCHREGRRIGMIVADDLRGRLPQAGDSVRVVPGDGVKLAVPQRIALSGPSMGLTHLQVRATAIIKGRLTLRHAGTVFWSRRLAARPERRILIPLAGMALAGMASPSSPASIAVAIEAD